jgi:hypothetical protein
MFLSLSQPLIKYVNENLQLKASPFRAGMDRKVYKFLYSNLFWSPGSWAPRGISGHPDCPSDDRCSLE